MDPRIRNGTWLCLDFLWLRAHGMLLQIEMVRISRWRRWHEDNEDDGGVGNKGNFSLNLPHLIPTCPGRRGYKSLTRFRVAHRLSHSPR